MSLTKQTFHDSICAEAAANYNPDNDGHEEMSFAYWHAGQLEQQVRRRRTRTLNHHRLLRQSPGNKAALRLFDFRMSFRYYRHTSGQLAEHLAQYPFLKTF